MHVEMKGIVKRFGDLIANDHIDIAFLPGGVHAVLGENGAGKSTLTKILAGATQPDAGNILIDGMQTLIHSPADAARLGIGMVYQHFMLVEPMTVMQNFVIGLHGVPIVPRFSELRQQILELSTHYQLNIDPDAFIWQLSIGEQQRVELLRLLHRGAEALIFDEPTAVLTPQEARKLGHTMRALAQQGKIVVMITHRLNEVMEFADSVSVMMQGKLITTLPTNQTSPTELAQLMIGRLVQTVPKHTTHPTAPETQIEVRALVAQGDRKLPALRNLSFTVQKGEIFGIAGVAGNGQRELVEVIVGLRPATAGQVLVKNVDLTNASPVKIRANGVGYIPQDRINVGTIPLLSVTENLAMKRYHEPPISRGLWLVKQMLTEFAQKLITQFKIKVSSEHSPVKHLSGGNIQKLILAREIEAHAGVLIAESPTHGLDLGATEAVHTALLDAANAGTAILLVSEDLDELLALSDRIAVMFEGEIMDILTNTGQVDIDQIGLMMTGILADIVDPRMHKPATAHESGASYAN